MEINFNRIYIDLDGVLVDFFTGLSDLFIDLGYIKEQSISDVEIFDTQRQFGVSEDLFWNMLDEQGSTFWRDLNPYPWTKYLWETCNRVCNDVIIVSTPSHDSRSASGKILWMNKHLGNGKPFRHYALCPQKHLLANPQTILIDDRVKVCNEFEQYGGKSILFPQLYNLQSPLKENETLSDLQWKVADRFHEYSFGLTNKVLF